MKDHDRRFQIGATEAVRLHLVSPPEGSAATRARDFGVDIFATARKLVFTTPEERLRLLDERIEELRATP